MIPPFAVQCRSESLTPHISSFPMPVPDSALPELPPQRPRRNHAEDIVATATVLGLLYFGRDVFIPITLALFLSLLIAPSVRGLRRAGLGHAGSVLVAVAIMGLALAAMGGIIGSQIVRTGASLPQYEGTIRNKLQAAYAMASTQLNAFKVHAGRVISLPMEQQPDVPDIWGSNQSNQLNQSGQSGSDNAVPVEVREPPVSPLAVITRIFSSVWSPLETAGIVLVVLIFVLLEHEALRDRFIRLVGARDLRSTTHAINDAGVRLSRFFVSQFAVNSGVGVAVWVGLTLIGLPHAPLCAILTAILRFVPYVGVWFAMLIAALLAAAVDPGWSLVIMTVSLYAVVEILAAQLVEPHLYGHTAGLSPLSVVIAAIFWGWLWGPAGLILSTPLTLCLVVAGRHVKALSYLEILFGDAPTLTLSQKFYQRALSGDAHEIIGDARVFLQRKSFAAYCDQVLLPALYLGRADLEARVISEEQQRKVRSAIVAVIDALGGEARVPSRRSERATALDDANLGRQLRRQRERLSGRWQGPLAVPPGTIVLCMGLGSVSSELATEILVRILRAQKVDCRHLAFDDLEAPPPEGASPANVSVICLVSVEPGEEREHALPQVAALRHRLPATRLLRVYLPGPAGTQEPWRERDNDTERSANSYVEAVRKCLEWHHPGPPA